MVKVKLLGEEHAERHPAVDVRSHIVGLYPTRTQQGPG